MKRPNPIAARAEMAKYLEGCSSVVLASLSTEFLASRFQVDRQVAEYDLIMVKRRRGA